MTRIWRRNLRSSRRILAPTVVRAKVLSSPMSESSSRETVWLHSFVSFDTIRGSWRWEKILSFVVMVWVMMMTVMVENLAAKTPFKLQRHDLSFKIMIVASFARLSLICPLVCSFAHLLTYLPTRSLIFPIVCSFAHSFADLHSYLLICRLVWYYFHSLAHALLAPLLPFSLQRKFNGDSGDGGVRRGIHLSIWRNASRLFPRNPRRRHQKLVRRWALLDWTFCQTGLILYPLFYAVFLSR